MPYNHEWQTRIKSVEREYLVMRQAADRFQQQSWDDSAILTSQFGHSDINKASKNLESTYVMRLFAEFESGARQYWEETWNTEPRTKDLLDGLAARCHIPDTEKNNGHSIRKYRNSLVHEREDDQVAVSIIVVRRYLCRFFSFLPQQW